LSEVRYDIAIIGGGPGGYAAALRAAQLNLNVAIIEKDKVGGTCLHRGCIPTTGLLQCARMLDNIKRSGKFGIKVEGVTFNWQDIQKAKGVAVNRLFMGLKTLLKHRKVDIIKGSARLERPGVVNVEGNDDISTVRASSVIIATGSSPQVIPSLKGNSGLVMNTDQALEISDVPESITIIGGGAYGVEFASLFKSFDSEVSIIETAPRLLPREDAEISKYLEKAFSRRGINMYTGVKLEEAQIKDNGVEIEISKNDERKTISSDKLLVTVGKSANTGNIDIEALGIETKNGFINAGHGMRTTAENIYAVGDVTHNPQYANFAFSEGIHAAETIAGLNPPELNLKQIPIYAFGYPEVAKVGYTEEEAKEAGFDIETVGLPFQSISRSAINKEDIGFAKMIAIKGGPIIGVHLIGAEVINLIPEAVLMTNWEATAQDIAQFLHPHPTFTEAIGEAALKLAGKPLHAL